MKKILATDAGGTKITYAVITETGEIIGEVKRKNTPKELSELEKIFGEIIAEHESEVDYIAFATAGAVNIENTKVESSTPNMPEGYNCLDFTKLSKKPVYVENDANAAAWCEYKIGAARGDNNTIIITLGTGVGGGFISEGKLIRGKSGRAGEVGSMKVNSRGRICNCGRSDCWESYASGTGLKYTAQETAANDELFKTSLYKNKKPKELTTYDIVEGVKNNDKFSLKVYEIWKSDIIRGLINITNIFDPDSIVISGGLCDFIDTEEIENAVNKETVVSPVKIKRALSGNYAGMKGAAILANERFLINI